MKNNDTFPSSDGRFERKDKYINKHSRMKRNSSVLIRKRMEQSVFDQLRARISDVGEKTNEIKVQFEEVEAKQNEIFKAQNEILNIFEGLTMANIMTEQN